MKTNEIRNLSEKELQEKIQEFEEELFNLRFQAKMGQLSNPLRMRTVKKIIARSKTILNENKKALQKT